MTGELNCTPTTTSEMGGFLNFGSALEGVMRILVAVVVERKLERFMSRMPVQRWVSFNGWRGQPLLRNLRVSRAWTSHIPGRSRMASSSKVSPSRSSSAFVKYSREKPTGHTFPASLGVRE